MGPLYSLYNIIKNTEFSYFHADAARSKNQYIQTPNELFEQDPLLKSQLKQFSGRVHCEHSQFFKGCIRVRRKTNAN